MLGFGVRHFVEKLEIPGASVIIKPVFGRFHQISQNLFRNQEQMTRHLKSLILLGHGSMYYKLAMTTLTKIVGFSKSLGVSWLFCSTYNHDDIPESMALKGNFRFDYSGSN